MSHRFKPPKMHSLEGSTRARLIRSAKNIQTQEQLDAVIARVDPKIADAFLNIVRPHLTFEPRDLVPQKSV